MTNKTEIKDFRKQLGWSQKRLADEIGSHHMTISRWESGDTPKTNSATWFALTKLIRANPIQEPAQ